MQLLVAGLRSSMLGAFMQGLTSWKMTRATVLQCVSKRGRGEPLH
jgi:hypothetical protein